MLAKWLNAKARILILDHPTRGIDVGAKEEVYELVRAVTAEGVAVILTSDTLEETIGLSHTVLVMRDGEVTFATDAEPGHKPRQVDLIGTWSEAAMKAMVEAIGTNSLRQWLPLATLVVLVALVGIAQPVFLQPASLLQLASDTAVLFILATGVTFVIMLGGIDLSIQSMASLASVIVALTITRLGYGAFVLAVAVGAVAGLLSGLAHVRLKIPSFIATLAMGGVLYSAALVISKERSITLERHRARLPDLDHRHAVRRPECHRHRPDRARRRPCPAEPHAFRPLQRCDRRGRAGRLRLRREGRPAEDHRLRPFRGLAALAGVILAGRLASGSPTLASELLLPSIAAVVVGGTAITGGVGSIWRTLVGALIISVVRIGMTFLGVNIFAQNIVFGAVLVAAVAITIDRSKIPIVK